MKLCYILYIIGSGLYILIGILHLIVHAIEWRTKDVKQKIKLAGSIRIRKKEISAWKLWQGFSLSFGTLIIFLGINNLLTLNNLSEKSLPVLVCICATNLLILTGITFAGYKYFGKIQFFGGILGFLLFSTSLVFLIYHLPF